MALCMLQISELICPGVWVFGDPTLCDKFSVTILKTLPHASTPSFKIIIFRWIRIGWGWESLTKHFRLLTVVLAARLRASLSIVHAAVRPVQPKRIGAKNRVVPHILVEIWTSLNTYWIFLEKSAGLGQTGAVLDGVDTI